MSLKWIFALVLVGYGVNVLASEIAFNEIIAENNKAQSELASEIQKQVGLTKQKTLKDLTVAKTVSLEGFTLKVFN